MENLVKKVINNIKKLVAYKWNGDFLKKLKPSGKVIKIPLGTTDNIKTGSIVLGVYIVVTFMIALLSLVLISNALGYWSNIMGADWRSVAIGNAIITALISVVIPFVLVLFLTGEKERKSLPYFIVLILVIGGIIFIITQIFSAFGLMKFSIIVALLNLIAVVIEFGAYTTIAVGCIDFILEANDEGNLATLEVKNETEILDLTKNQTNQPNDEQP